MYFISVFLRSTFYRPRFTFAGDLGGWAGFLGGEDTCGPGVLARE